MSKIKKYIDPIELIRVEMVKLLSRPKGWIIGNHAQHLDEVAKYANALNILISDEVRMGKMFIKNLKKENKDE